MRNNGLYLSVYYLNAVVVELTAVFIIYYTYTALEVRRPLADGTS